MASGILVYCEHEHGHIKKTAYELLTKARELAGGVGGGVSAVVIGSGETGELAAHGAETIYTVQGPAFEHYSNAAYTKALAAAVAQADPAVVLGAASSFGKDLFPRAATRGDSGLASEVTELSAAGGAVVGRRPIYAGKASVEVRVSSTPAFFTVRPNSFGAPSKAPGAGAVQALSVELSADEQLDRTVEVIESSSEIADLTEAERIVSGGRSLKSQENFESVIVPLAKVLGATPGASRAAVDAGYAPHSWQVGQTGKVVNANLYIAAGISGAIQHLAGMRTSKVIVAINKDPEAPIFQHSTYGIVDDLFDVCPALTDALGKALGG